MEIYVINLERSVNRRASMEKILTSASLEFNFYRAVDGSIIDSKEYREYTKFVKLSRSRDLLPGEVGCFASHFNLWKRCVDVQRPLLIMEDDVYLEPFFHKHLGFVESNIEKYGFIRLNSRITRPHETILLSEEGLRVVRFPWGATGTVCYAIHPAAAEKLLAKANIWLDPVDDYMDYAALHKVDSYAILPSSVKCNNEFNTEISGRSYSNRRFLVGTIVKHIRSITRMLRTLKHNAQISLHK